MDRRTTGIIATIAAVLLCGFPGLISLCGGAIAAIVSYIPGATIDIFGSNDPRAALFTGLGMLCLGVLFIAIPFVVGFLTLRQRPEMEEPEPVSDEPIPPAI